MSWTSAKRLPLCRRFSTRKAGWDFFSVIDQTSSFFNGEKKMIYINHMEISFFVVSFGDFFWQNICWIDFGYGLEMVQYDQPPKKKMIGCKTWDG